VRASFFPPSQAIITDNGSYLVANGCASYSPTLLNSGTRCLSMDESSPFLLTRPDRTSPSIPLMTKKAPHQKSGFLVSRFFLVAVFCLSAVLMRGHNSDEPEFESKVFTLWYVVCFFLACWIPPFDASPPRVLILYGLLVPAVG